MTFISLVENLNEIDFEQVVNLFEICGWGNRGGALFLKKAYLNSTFAVFALSREKQVLGTIRILSDGVYYATIHDFLVHPAYRGQKIGTALLNRALQFVKNIPTVLVSALPESVSYYERFGFVRHQFFLARFLNPEKENIFSKL